MKKNYTQASVQRIYSKNYSRHTNTMLLLSCQRQLFHSPKPPPGRFINIGPISGIKLESLFSKEKHPQPTNQPLNDVQKKNPIHNLAA